MRLLVMLFVGILGTAAPLYAQSIPPDFFLTLACARAVKLANGTVHWQQCATVPALELGIHLACAECWDGGPRATSCTGCTFTWVAP